MVAHWWINIQPGIAKGLFRGHTSVSDMKTSAVSLGAIDAILDILESEFKEAVIEELEAEETFLKQ